MGVGVLFGGFRSVMRSVVEMALGDEGMMRGGMVIASFMTSSGFAMMTGRVLVVFGCFAVVLDGLL